MTVLRVCSLNTRSKVRGSILEWHCLCSIIMSVCLFVRILSRRSVLNFSIFCNETWHVLHHHELMYLAKRLVSYFKVKVKMKIWFFQLYLLSCWLVCKQTCVVSTLLQAGVSSVSIRVLCSSSRSQQTFKMSVNYLPIFMFWTAETCVAKLGITMNDHKLYYHAKHGFATIKVKVTLRAHNYKIHKKILFLLCLLNC